MHTVVFKMNFCTFSNSLYAEKETCANSVGTKCSLEYCNCLIFGLQIENIPIFPEL